MEKEKIIKLIEENKTQREIADFFKVSQSSVKHWMKKYNLKTKRAKFKIHNDENLTHRVCVKCGKEKEKKEFYNRSDNGNLMSFCKRCANDYYTERMKNVKVKMINYKGGKCENEECGLTLEGSHYSVFEFHHINPEEKDPKFNKVKFWKWERIEKEIDKCKMLCANCHRMEHAKIEGW